MASSGARAEHRDPRLRPAVTGALALLLAAMVITAIATGTGVALAALGALLVVVAAMAAVAAVLARRASQHDPAMEAVTEREREARPEVFMSGKADESGGDGEDDTALGDTAEAHDEINPHDLPPDHPGRQAAEEEARGAQGTTGGHRDPSDADEAGSS